METLNLINDELNEILLHKNAQIDVSERIKTIIQKHVRKLLQNIITTKYIFLIF